MKGREGGLLAERSGWRGRPDSAFSASATHQKCIAKDVADGVRLALDSISKHHSFGRFPCGRELWHLCTVPTLAGTVSGVNRPFPDPPGFRFARPRDPDGRTRLGGRHPQTEYFEDFLLHPAHSVAGIDRRTA